MFGFFGFPRASAHAGGHCRAHPGGFTAGFAVGKELGVRRALERMPVPAPVPVVSGAEAGKPTHTLAVRYFHSTKRCKKCNLIEEYSKEALETGFPASA